MCGSDKTGSTVRLREAVLHILGVGCVICADACRFIP